MTIDHICLMFLIYDHIKYLMLTWQVILDILWFLFVTDLFSTVASRSSFFCLSLLQRQMSATTLMVPVYKDSLTITPLVLFAYEIMSSRFFSQMYASMLGTDRSSQTYPFFLFFWKKALCPKNNPETCLVCLFACPYKWVLRITAWNPDWILGWKCG